MTLTLAVTAASYDDLYAITLIIQVNYLPLLYIEEDQIQKGSFLDLWIFFPVSSHFLSRKPIVNQSDTLHNYKQIA